MAFDKSIFDKKTFFTLIAFIAVGILLFGMIFAHNSSLSEKARDNETLNAQNNVPASEKAYYGSEAESSTDQVYDKNGAPLDLSLLTEETELYDQYGKKLNLPTISESEYASIKEGMSYTEVCEIVGGIGKIVSEVDKPGDAFYTVCYFFYGDKAESSASFIFQGDRLKSKANTNLADKK